MSYLSIQCAVVLLRVFISSVVSLHIIIAIVGSENSIDPLPTFIDQLHPIFARRHQRPSTLWHISWLITALVMILRMLLFLVVGWQRHTLIWYVFV